MLDVVSAIVVWIFLCTAQIYAYDSVQPKICQKLITTSDCGEKGGNCESYIDIECHHGTCSELRGQCVCDPCWTGEKCHILENKHVPEFDQEQLSVDINVNKLFKNKNNVVTTVNAKDHDSTKCSSDEPCPCATVLYSIERGNEKALFMIDPRKGELSFSARGDETPSRGETYDIVVSARNPVHKTRSRGSAHNKGDVDSQSTSSIVVTVNFIAEEPVREEYKAHSRQRRSTDGLPSDGQPTFVLDKITSVTEIKYGDDIALQLTIWLPQGNFTGQVELLTQYESSAIMSICSPVISTIGGNFGSFSENDAPPTLIATAGDSRYDRVTFDISVNNDASNTADAADNQILITFTALVEYNNATQDGEEYWVSAGVTYGQDVWVSLATFTFADDTSLWAWQAPVITVTAPATAPLEAATVIIIDILLENIGIPDFYVDVIATNFTASDNVWSVGSLELSGKGSGFDCLPYELPQYSAVNDNETGLISTGRLDFGPIVNTAYRDDDTSASNHNTITLKATICAGSGIEGETYWIGFAFFVQLDNDTIYTQQVAIENAAVAAPDAVNSPSFEFYAMDGYNIIFGGGIGFIINIFTTPGTSHLIVDISLPYESNQAVMHLWRATILYRGKNIPCVGLLTPAYFREDNTNVDYIQFDFGRVSNMQVDTSDTNNDLLQIHFSSELLESHPSVANGSEFFVQAGVRYELIDKDVLWASEISVFARDRQYDMYTEPEKQPRFTLTNRARDNVLYNDTTVSFDFTVYIPPSTTYTPLHVNISAERGEDNGTLFSFCSLHFWSIGDNFHLTEESMIQITNYTDEEGHVTDYNIDFGIVSNTMPEDRAGEETDSSFEFELRIKWINHDPWLENGTVVSAFFDATYGPEGQWNESIGYEISYSMPELTSLDRDPDFNFYLDPTRNNTLRVGGAAVYYLDTNVPPNSVAAYFVDVVAPNDTLSVCAVRLVSAGKHMPCFETDRVVNYWSYEEDYQRDRGKLDIGAIRNIGYESETTNEADNLMLTQVIVKLEDRAIPMESNTTDNYTMVDLQEEFYLTSSVGTSKMYSAAEAINVDTRPAMTNLATFPEITLTKDDPEILVTKGGGVVFNLDIYIPYDSILNYGITFQSDIEDTYRATICSARIISSGWNVPCVNGSFLHGEYSSTNGDAHIDQGYLDAMDITNIEQETGDSPPLRSAVNKVRVQLIARLEANDTHIEEGDPIWIGAALNINGFNEYYIETRFNATETPIYEQTYPDPEFQIDCPNRNVSLTIGSKEVYFIKITTPKMSTPMTLNVTMPISGDEALLTIVKMDYVTVGENYACYDRLKLEPEYDSKFNTSQNTSAIVDLGVLTNHGTSHIYQYYPGKQEDNEMIISLEVQLADNYDLVDGALINFDVEFQYSLGRTHVITEEILVVKTGLEEPELEYNITFFNYNPFELHQEDKIRAFITLYHTNTSSAHAHAVFINFMLPYYLEIDEDVEIEGPLFCVKESIEGVKFHFEEMFFTDTFTMWFNFTLDPFRYMPMELIFVNTTVPLEAVYYGLNEIDGNGSVVLGNSFKTHTELLDLTFTIEDCFDSLGLESGYIEDCQIRSSSAYNTSFGPEYGRLNIDGGWGPGTRFYPPYVGYDYYEVSFGGLYRFTGIKMQVGPANQSYVESYRLSYTDDGLIWNDYEEGGQVKIFENDYWANGTEYNSTIEDPWVVNRMSLAFNAQKIRILPMSYTENSTAMPVVRFELMGCQKDVVVQSPTDFCDAGDGSNTPHCNLPDYGYYERGFLVEPYSGYVYVCILEYVDGPTRCSLSRDNGTTWEDMDNNVANVLAIHHNDIDLELFGLSQNKKAIMRSDDLGVTWYSVSPARYLHFLANQLEYMTKAVRVPFVKLPVNPPSRLTLNNDFVMSGNRSYVEWGAGANGMYRRDMFMEEREIYIESVESTTIEATTEETNNATMPSFTTDAKEEVTAPPAGWDDGVNDESSWLSGSWSGFRNISISYPSPWELIGIWHSVEGLEPED